MHYAIGVHVRDNPYKRANQVYQRNLLIPFESLVGLSCGVSIKGPDMDHAKRLEHIMGPGLIWSRAHPWTLTDLAIQRKFAADECSDRSPGAAMAKYLSFIYHKWTLLASIGLMGKNDAIPLRATSILRSRHFLLTFIHFGRH